jgi:hypothetical protein
MAAVNRARRKEGIPSFLLTPSIGFAEPLEASFHGTMGEVLVRCPRFEARIARTRSMILGKKQAPDRSDTRVVAEVEAGSTEIVPAELYRSGCVNPRGVGEVRREHRFEKGGDRGDRERQGSTPARKHAVAHLCRCVI